MPSRLTELSKIKGGEALGAVMYARETEKFAHAVVAGLIGSAIIRPEPANTGIVKADMATGTLNKVSDALSGIHASLAAIEAQLARLKGR